MRKAPWVCLCLLTFSVLSSAQTTTPKAEIYGGYSYLNADTNSLSGRISTNGWEASVSVNANKTVAVEASGSGYYKNNLFNSGIDISDYDFVFGPRLNYRGAFVHALFGFDHLTGSVSGFGSASQNGFAMALGGGAVAPISEHFGIRGSFDYVMTQHNVIGDVRVDQNNFRVGAGIVFFVGGSGHHTRSATSSTTGTPRRSTAGTESIPQLGVSGYESQGGFLITEVSPNSPLANQGVTGNDLLFSVDGKPVHTAADVKAALPSSGTVKLGIMLARSAPVERTVEIK